MVTSVFCEQEPTSFLFTTLDLYFTDFFCFLFSRSDCLFHILQELSHNNNKRGLLDDAQCKSLLNRRWADVSSWSSSLANYSITITHFNKPEPHWTNFCSGKNYTRLWQKQDRTWCSLVWKDDWFNSLILISWKFFSSKVRSCLSFLFCRQEESQKPKTLEQTSSGQSPCSLILRAEPTVASILKVCFWQNLCTSKLKNMFGKKNQVKVNSSRKRVCQSKDWAAFENMSNKLKLSSRSA